jgi:hypothetical protein
MDTLDILSELLARFGHSVANNPQVQKRIQNVLIPLLSHSRPAFRKRTTIALGTFKHFIIFVIIRSLLITSHLGNLVTHTPDDLFNELVQQLLVEFSRAGDQNDKLKTLVQCVGTLRHVIIDQSS